MQRPFDLILFTDHFPYGISESFLSDELQYLSEAFGNILIVPLDASGDSPAREVPGNVTVLAPPFRDYRNRAGLVYRGILNRSPVVPFIRRAFTDKVWRSAPRFRNWATAFLLVRSLLAHLRQSLPPQKISPRALLYFYWGLRWSQVIPFLPGGSCRIAMRMHGSDLYEELNHNYIPFRKEQLDRADSILLISEMSVRYLLGKYPGTASKTILSRLGTRDHGINPPGDPQAGVHLVSCGNLVPVKRVGLLASCLKFMPNRKITWTHFGTGPEMELVSEIVRRDGATFRAELKGWVSNRELMAFYATRPVDLFVNTSSSEGVPVAVMEALSFGIPVIATDVGGTSEILGENCGRIIPAAITPEQLAAAINGFLSSAGMDGLRRNARAQWEKTCNCSVLYPEMIAKLLKLAGTDPG